MGEKEATEDGAKIIDQRSIQARGGVCAKYPVSCLIRDMLAQAGLLKPLARLNVLDVTFGEGRFYPALRPRVYAFDIRRLKLHYKPVKLVLRPCFHWRKYILDISRVLGEVHLVVVDPPFSTTREWDKRAPHYHAPNLHYSEAIVRSCGLESAKLFNSYLLYHYLKPLDNIGAEVLGYYYKPLHRYSALAKSNILTYFALVKP